MNDDLSQSDAHQALRSQLTTVLTGLKDTLQADVVCLFVYDADTESFHLPIGLGLRDPDSFFDPRMRPRGDRGAAKQIIQNSSLIMEHIEERPELNAAFAHREQIRSMAGVACSFQETIVGVLYVNYRTHHTFNDAELARLHHYAAQLAELIAASSILQNLPKTSIEPNISEERTLRGIVELVCSYTHSPVGIWLLDNKDKNCLRIRASTGLPVRYRNEAVCHIDDPCLISKVFTSGEWKVVEDLQQDKSFPYKEIAAAAGWISVFGFPISCRGRRVGVLESFTFSPWQPDKGLIAAHRQLANLAGITLENFRRSEEAERLAELAREMSAAPDFDSSLHSIVKAARELTGAYSSSIFLYDKRSRRFNKEVRSPKLQIPADLPREKGLSSYIIESGKVVHIHDSGHDKLANQIRETERANSLIGVRLDIGQEGVGVLYVRGNQPHQFIEADEKLLTTIAAQASLALGLGRFLLKPISEIEAAAAKRYEQEAILETICVETGKLGFEYAAIQLIRPEEKIIETVYTNAPSDWTGVAKHSLEAEPAINDIQAEIALADPPCIKIITGRYEKFDPWIYDEFDHQHYARVWVPIVLVRNERGFVEENWFNGWTNMGQISSKDNENNDDTKEKRPGRCISITMPLPINLPKSYKAETIGTLEAGYYDPNATVEQLHGRISTGQAIDLAKLAARLALELRKTLLPYVLESIADRAWEIIRADSASLYFLYSQKRKKYSYELCMGEFSRQFLEGHQPRENGLGQSAICKGEVQFVPDATLGHHKDQLKDSNPTVWEVGVRAMAAFPLLIDEKSDKQKGVLYVLFSKSHWFTADEIGWIKLFASRAVEAIRNSLHYAQARDNAKALSVLHSVSRSLAAKPQDEHLLRQIAGYSMNVFAADIVSIYEYVETLNRFPLPHDRAGRLLVDIEVSGLEAHAGPILLLKSKRDVYFTSGDSINDSIMNSPDLERPEMGSFVEREKIKSSAGIILRVGTEIVGVMFVHFRRPHLFTDQEKQIIQTLAANAALAIKNRRRFDTLKAGSRAILTTLDLDKLLGLIVKQAATITGGDVANIRLVEGTASDELVAHARFPEYEPVDENLKCLKQGEGLLGWVVMKKKARIITDCNDEPNYKHYFHGLRSLLYVPMLTGDEKLLGVLISGSRTASKFDERDGMMLEALADQAIIALQNAQNQKRLAAAEAMATLGDIAGNLLHRINNDVGAIRVNSMMLEEQLEGKFKTITRCIIELSEQFLKEAAKLNESIPDRLEGIDIIRALDTVLQKVRLKNIEICRKLPETLALVKGGEAQIQYIFENLIQNAIDAMPSGGKLTIIAEISELDKKTFSTVCICDTGKGISANQIDKVFSRDYSTKGSGHGFGLWWNKNYIERLGGKIKVSSEVGQGTCFTIHLPQWVSRVVVHEQPGELK